VASEIEEACQKRAKRTEITQDRVLQELARIGFADIRKAVKWGSTPTDPDEPGFEPNGLNMYPVALVPSSQIDDGTAAAITEVSLTQAGVKLKLADKKSALDTMLKHLGGLPDDEAPSLNININAAEPVGNVRVTRSNG